MSSLLCAGSATGLALLVSTGLPANVGAASGPQVKDPGVRAGSANAGRPLSSLSADEREYFADGQARFLTLDTVTGTNNGLGPSFNSNSCGSCHAQPATGGTSPALNPQIAAASDDGASNIIPDFISASSPVREARFPFLVNANGTLSTTADGGVHDLFTISGRADAPGCDMAQPNFVQAQELNNIIFRIPTPLFGAGLIENIPDATIYGNLAA
ncbi:MAG: hypothetical protein ABSE57_33805, partial [Bryobacteraceae bacterium]